MNFATTTADREAILPLRELYRQELDCQIVHDCAHDRSGCVEWHLLRQNGQIAGYGAVWTGPYWMPRGSVFEFYAVPDFRTEMFPLFEGFLAATKPSKIYAQTNDPFLGTFIYDYIEATVVGHILFEDRRQTSLRQEDVTFRQVTPEDKSRIFEHRVEPVGDWLLECQGKIVATGGVLYHYNRPYGDLFMEVHPDFRRRGFGSYLIQELKRVCQLAGNIPAARCRPQNVASRRTLERAGFAPCARLIWGDTTAGNGTKQPYASSPRS